jgi:5-bromo-4-chloroindolyl phosphate hydrolysis protein
MQFVNENVTRVFSFVGANLSHCNMGVSQLSDGEKGYIIGQLDAGKTYEYISSNLKRAKSTVHAFIKTYKATNSIKRKL